MGAILLGALLAALLVSAVHGWFSGKSHKLAEDAHNRKLRKELEDFQIGFRDEAQKRLSALSMREAFVSGLKDSFSRDFVSGRKWLAEFISEADRALDESIVQSLGNKKRAAPKAAEEVSVARREKRKYKEEALLLKYQLMTFREYFPFIADYEDVILNEEIDFPAVSNGLEALSDTDPVLRIVGKSDYERLPIRERNQLALARYLRGNLSQVAVGKLYERYLGYLYERDGWRVEYHGIVHGLEDLGRDLVCRKEDKIKIVQAKCWSSQKQIHEKHVFQLFGTTQLYLMDQKSVDMLPNSVRACLVTSTSLSPVARRAADWLEIEVLENFPLDKSFPMIKCNISSKSKEKIYHLPFDQQYDRVKIDISAGEFYALTVDEAEDAGFRRAFRFSGMAH